MANCVFGCGAPRPLHNVTHAHAGAHISPRWVCHPCNSARTAIECAAKNGPELKASAANLKTTDPEMCLVQTHH